MALSFGVTVLPDPLLGAIVARRERASVARTITTTMGYGALGCCWCYSRSS